MYKISDYVQKNIDKILYLSKEICSTQEENAYFIYHELLKIFHENIDFGLSIDKEEKVKLYEKQVENDGKAVCVQIAKAVAEALAQIGIKTYVIYQNPEQILAEEKNLLKSKIGTTAHADLIIKMDNGKTYFCDPIKDVARIQTGKKVRNFGINEDILKCIIKTYYLDAIKRLFGEISTISEEEILNYDKKMGFNLTGIYTDDVIAMLEDKIKGDKGKAFFGIQEREDLLERKIEFINETIGIPIGYRDNNIEFFEGIRYFQKFYEKLFDEEEIKHFIKLYVGYSTKNNIQPEAILVQLKKNGNNYYRYNTKERKYIKIDNILDLIKLDIVVKKTEKSQDGTINESFVNLKDEIEIIDKKEPPITTDVKKRIQNVACNQLSRNIQAGQTEVKKEYREYENPNIDLDNKDIDN